MCGLGSITLSTDATLDAAKLDLGVARLLSSLDHRGGDACGLMAVGTDGALVTQSAPCKAQDFNQGRLRMTSACRAVAVHTRMATKGKAWWNENNHPVQGPNGAFVMHNGVVADSWVQRKPDDPEVDTFALALLVGKAARRRNNEKPHTFAQRLVRAAADADGSQTLQLAVQNQPLLVSACVRTNPLYMAESVDGTIRVTASTYDAVKQAFAAMDVLIPFEEKTYETSRKGKKHTHVGKSDVIYRLNEGDVLSWFDGVHAETHIQLAEPSRKRYQHTAQSSTPYAHSANQPRYSVGDIMRRLSSQELGVIIGINRNHRPITYRCEWLNEQGQIGFAEATEAMLTLRQKTRPGMTLQQDREELKRIVRDDAADHAVMHADAEPTRVVTTPTRDVVRTKPDPPKPQAALGAPRAAGTGGAEATEHDERQRLVNEAFDEIAQGMRSGHYALGFVDRCELCGQESQHIETYEEVDLCATCLHSVRTDSSAWLGL